MRFCWDWAIKTLWIGWLLFPSLVHATQVVAYSDQEMVTRSTLVFWGRVTAQKVHKVGPQQRIVTDHTIQIRRTFKGSTLARFITIRCLGGKLQGQEAHVYGAGQLQIGEEAILYVEAARPLPWQPHPAHYYLTGMGYGLWKLRWSPKHRQYQGFRQADLPTRLARDPQGRWRPLPHLHEKPQMMGTLVQNIQRYAKLSPRTTPKTRTTRSLRIQQQQITSPSPQPKIPSKALQHREVR